MSEDPWRCERCGAGYDLAARSLEVGLVRFARRGPDGFRLGSQGIEDEIAPLLERCACGGRLVAGRGAKTGSDPVFAGKALRPLASVGWQVLEAADDPGLRRLREVWRPRALRLLGREGDLSADEVHALRLEDRLAELEAEVRRATAAGDDDAAQMAHARYIEVGTSYARRFPAR